METVCQLLILLNGLGYVCNIASIIGLYNCEDLSTSLPEDVLSNDTIIIIKSKIMLR